MAIEHGDDVGVRKRWLEWIDKTSDTPSLDDRQQYAGPRGSFLRHLPSLTVSQTSMSVPSCDWGRAAWATRWRCGESGRQSPSHRCNRVRDVAFRPQRRILWAGNLRVGQFAGTTWWPDLLRGESSPARRSGTRRPQCKGWRDGGSRAIPALQNAPARPPA
jgi:hypothetical protein